MADLKISQLAAATQLAGSEVVPVVQSGATKKATIEQILTPAATSGVNFSQNTPAAGATSQLFKWYEEGTWTPSLGGTATYTANTKGWYTRVGRLVVAQCDIEINIIGTGSTQAVSGLPYASNASAPQASGSVALFNGIAINVYDLAPYVPEAFSSVYFRAQTALDTSNIGNAAIFGDGARVQFTVMYFV
jgi:hypothetical protein